MFKCVSRSISHHEQVLLRRGQGTLPVCEVDAASAMDCLLRRQALVIFWRSSGLRHHVRVLRDGPQPSSSCLGSEQHRVYPTYELVLVSIRCSMGRRMTKKGCLRVSTCVPMLTHASFGAMGPELQISIRRLQMVSSGQHSKSDVALGVKAVVILNQIRI